MALTLKNGTCHGTATAKNVTRTRWKRKPRWVQTEYQNSLHFSLALKSHKYQEVPEKISWASTLWDKSRSKSILTCPEAPVEEKRERKKKRINGENSAEFNLKSVSITKNDTNQLLLDHAKATPLPVILPSLSKPLFSPA